MKVVGRIILVAVAIGALVYAIPNIINAWKALQGIAWSDIFTVQENLSAFVSLVGAAATGLLGVFALVEAILGKASFICLVISIIAIGVFIWYCIEENNAGKLTDFWSWFHMIAGFAMPLGFALGTVFVAMPA